MSRGKWFGSWRGGELLYFEADYKIYLPLIYRFYKDYKLLNFSSN